MTGLRETYDPGHKFSDHMAAFIHDAVMGNGDFGDDEWSDGNGNWANRYGRRIIEGDDYGFVRLTTYPTVAEAARAWQEWQARVEREQDRVCIEQGCTGTVCRHCGQAIHKVTEPNATYYESDEDGDSLSYVPTLHDHEPILDDDSSTHVIGCDRDWIG